MTCIVGLLFVLSSISTTIHRYQIFSTRYYVMCKVYTGYCGTNEIEHGLCACTVDNPLAKARGLSLRTGAQTMLYLSLAPVFLFPHILVKYLSKSTRGYQKVLSLTWKEPEIWIYSALFFNVVPFQLHTLVPSSYPVINTRSVEVNILVP